MRKNFNGFDDKNLVLVAEKELQKLIETGGSSFTMRIPADPSRDTDFIFSEIINRLKNHSAALVDIALWNDKLTDEWGDPGGRAFEALKISNVTVHFCRKCGGRCKEARALVNPIFGSPEFSDGDMAGATLSAAADAVILDCFKCEDCGHSFTASI